ncbi:FAD-dependent oxidoreductase [Horticoccus sp. 23ND18S-11]|uniref:FAD-dependent oxidoreductase n=1 Tax=Horticoccus sp. 23ND18S-11 TaxID=3391832 RepID=UPI0039C9A057
MKRRTFLTTLGTVSASSALVAADLPKPPRTVDTDVLIIGGGTAGTIAAVQAARLGARTMLVESGSQLGGTTTTAGVDFPGLFHAWGKQVIAGIGWELVTAAVDLNSGDLPDFTKPTGRQHWRHQVRINGALYAALAEEACLKAGVQLRYYEFPLAVTPLPAGWRVRLVGKGTNLDVTTKQLVDCTGNASVVGLIGLPRLREKSRQPGTLIYRIGGYDLATIDMNALQVKLDAARKSGALKPTDINGSIAGFLGKGGESGNHIPGADSSTSETHTDANVLGRQALLRVLRFLKQEPAFALMNIERLQAEAGIRETFRIVGETTITHDDYTSGRVFADAVSHSFYPIDLHYEGGVTPKHLNEGIVPTVPRGALIPKGSTNLMVAGRCLSSDQLANSALRVQASCMAMGQAAGVNAALAAKAGLTPLQVPVADVRRELARHAAIVPKVA